VEVDVMGGEQMGEQRGLERAEGPAAVRRRPPSWGIPGYFRVFRAEKPESVGAGSLKKQPAEGTREWKKEMGRKKRGG
jgi:hypothetical protein